MKNLKPWARAFGLTAIVLFSSCGNDISFPAQLWWVTPQLQKHVDQFFIEAELRDKDFQQINLMVFLTYNEANGVNPGRFGVYKRVGLQKFIYIYAPAFYSSADKLNEITIFHELGHWQGLKHDNSHNNIMNAHPDDVYLYGAVLDSAKREKALDEFFDKL